MTQGDNEQDYRSKEKKSSQNVRDLVDFYLRWSEFRDKILDISRSNELTLEQKELITWLIKLVDRVGRQDITYKK